MVRTLVNEGPAGFLKRLRKKPKEELSYAEVVFLEVADKADKEAVLGQGSGTKL